MTLIGIACYGNYAQYVTDTMSYARNVRTIGSCTKSLPLHHLDAAVLTQGASMFGVYAKTNALEISDQLDTFDDLAATAQHWLKAVWADVCDNVTGAELNGATAHLVGYSNDAGCFQHWFYTADRDFEPELRSGLFIYPSPMTMRASEMEMRRFDEWRGGDYDDAVEMWQAKPEPTVPAGSRGWVELVKTVRTQRALEPWFRTLVGGSAYLTTVHRNRITTERIHRFADDNPAEFTKLVHRSQHPLAQAEDCVCGSDKTWRDCCLADYYADGHTCDCGSGRLFRACCSIHVQSTAT